jgi:UDP-2,4-diacetamido-2,4,6-trideoxy-beta-L-altropyranose hydrolase
VVLVADARGEDGLGHLARCSAVAAALARAGLATRMLGLGLERALVRSGLEWEPVAGPAMIDPVSGGALVLDSYDVGDDDVAAARRGARYVVFEDRGRRRDAADLVVAPAEGRSDDPRRLTGLQHACLGPDYWDARPATGSDPVRRILVAVGGANAADGGAIAGLVAEAVSGAEVRVVRGPAARWAAPAGTTVLEAPASLRDALCASDLVVCSAGQTMLEALACGAPCVAFVTAENQRSQVRLLEREGAIVLAADDLADRVRALVAAPDARRAQARRGRAIVDGRGALRVAARIQALISRASE